MLKKIIQTSSLAGLLALAVILPAAAASDEDAAAPAGSFTSAMTIPARVDQGHCFGFGHHHARMDERMRHRFG